MIKKVVTWFQSMVNPVTECAAPNFILFNDRFMIEHTEFLTWEEFRNMRGNVLAQQPDETLFQTEDWDQYVQETTTFSSWEAMLYRAEERYIIEKPFGPYQMM